MKNKILIALALVVIAAASIGIFLKNAYVVPVAMYHSLGYDDKTTKLSVSPESFARQMSFLRRNNYNVVRLEEIIPYVRKSLPAPPRTLAITFDDGTYDNYKYAYPVLKKYNIPATIFVIVDKVGEPGYLKWGEIKEMSDSGVITIGSHTLSHKWLPSLNQKDLERELKDSKAILERKLGERVTVLSYPLGAFDDRVKKVARDAGYSYAVATNPGRFKPTDDIYAVKRIRISRTSDNLFVFWVETSGYYTWIKEHRDE